MNQSKKENSRQSISTIDTALATEEQLIPSSGFLASVMDQVKDESRMPAPIPFPWKRAIPGILLVVFVLGWGAVEFVRQAIPAMRSMTFTPPQISAAVSRPLEALEWVALAFAISLISWVVSRRLTDQSGSM
jgi:hypothetical protein